MKSERNGGIKMEAPKILVVDDEKHQNNVICSYLKKITLMLSDA